MSITLPSGVKRVIAHSFVYAFNIRGIAMTILLIYFFMVEGIVLCEFTEIRGFKDGLMNFARIQII